MSEADRGGPTADVGPCLPRMVALIRPGSFTRSIPWRSPIFTPSGAHRYHTLCGNLCAHLAKASLSRRLHLVPPVQTVLPTLSALHDSPDFSKVLASKYTRLHISLEDADHANLLPHLDETSSFITQALQGGSRVLVHCAAGISRSATVVAAYLMVTEQMTADEALKSLQQKARWVRPNPGFMHQLALFADMGHKVDPNYGPYQAMLLTQQRVLVTLNTRPLPKHGKAGDYVCKHCHRLLVTADHVVSRESELFNDKKGELSQTAAQGVTAAEQPFLLVKPQRWMGGSMAAAQELVGSILQCPNCGRQIGLFSWGNKPTPGIAELHMPDGVHHPRPQLWVSNIAVSEQE